MTTTLANMGTPLMWLGCAHLLFLNFLLGWIEAKIIARLLRLERTTTLTWALIAANYASAWAGFVLLPRLWDRLADLPAFQPPLSMLTPLLLIAFAASFVGTLAVELPFAAAALRRVQTSTGRKLGAFAAAQVITYAGLAMLYTLTSTIVSADRITYTQASEIAARTQPGWVYHRDTSGQLARTRLDGSQTERLGRHLPAPDGSPWGARQIFIDPLDPSGPRLVFVHAEDTAHPAGAHGEPTPPQPFPLPEGTPAVPLTYDGWPSNRAFDVARLRAPVSGDLAVWTGLMAGEPTAFSRLEGKHHGPAFRRFGLSTPIAHWQARDFSVLPNDIVVFAWGESQIVIMDPSTGEAGVIARGTGPAVLLDDPDLAPPLRWPDQQPVP